RETFLQHTRERIAERCQRLPGPRKRAQVIPYAVVRVKPLDNESLFALLAVALQRAIREPFPARPRVVIINQENNPRRVQRPEAEMARERGDRCSDLDFRVGPAEAHPTEVEHLPAPQSFDGFVENRLAVSEPDAAMIGGVAGWRRPERLADFGVVERRRSARIYETLNEFA